MSDHVIRGGIPPSFCTASDNNLKLSFSLLRRCCRCLSTPVAAKVETQCPQHMIMTEAHCLSKSDDRITLAHETMREETVHHLQVNLATVMSLQTLTTHCEEKVVCKSNTHLG